MGLSWESCTHPPLESHYCNPNASFCDKEIKIQRHWLICPSSLVVDPELESISPVLYNIFPFTSCYFKSIDAVLCIIGLYQ